MRLLRYILWIVIAFIIAKVVRIVLGWRRGEGRPESKIDIPASTLNTIQDAEFEDITPGGDEPPPNKPPPSQP